MRLLQVISDGFPTSSMEGFLVMYSSSHTLVAAVTIRLRLCSMAAPASSTSWQAEPAASQLASPDGFTCQMERLLASVLGRRGVVGVLTWRYWSFITITGYHSFQSNYIHFNIL